MTRSHFVEILMILAKYVFDVKCPVDRVFRICGVRNSEVLRSLLQHTKNTVHRGRILVYH